jgi:hypothetical protein
MAKDKTSGVTPPKSEAGEGNPQIAETTDHAPQDRDELTFLAEILSQLSGLLWTDAKALLIRNFDAKLVQAAIDNFEAEWHVKTTHELTKPRLAMGHLILWLHNSELFAKGRVHGQFDLTRIPQSFWDDAENLSFNGNSIERGELKVHDVRVYVPQHLESVEGQLQEQKKGPGGRPPKYDWDDLLSTWLNRLIGDKKGFLDGRTAAYGLFIEVCKAAIEGDGYPDITLFAKTVCKKYPEVAAACGIGCTDAKTP